jgi:hypothetical protein
MSAVLRQCEYTLFAIEPAGQLNRQWLLGAIDEDNFPMSEAPDQ